MIYRMRSGSDRGSDKTEGEGHEATYKIDREQGFLQDGSDDRSADHDPERDYQLCQSP